jgi:hypothetical protein
VNRPYRLLVTGSRAWRNVTLIRNVLGSVHREHPGAVLVSGRCPTGADAISESCWAAFCGMTVDEAIGAGRIEPHPADWDRTPPPGLTAEQIRLFRKAAGPDRNAGMVKAGADGCVSFWKRSAGNRGTANCVGLAREAGIPVREFWSP